MEGPARRAELASRATRALRWPEEPPAASLSDPAARLRSGQPERLLDYLYWRISDRYGMPIQVGHGPQRAVCGALGDELSDRLPCQVRRREFEKAAVALLDFIQLLRSDLAQKPGDRQATDPVECDGWAFGALANYQLRRNQTAILRAHVELEVVSSLVFHLDSEGLRDNKAGTDGDGTTASVGRKTSRHSPSLPQAVTHSKTYPSQRHLMIWSLHE